MAKFIGIDQSLTGTAVCVLSSEDDKIAHVSTVKNKLVGMQRIIFIRDAVSDLVSHWDITARAFIEGYAFNARGSSVFNLGELGGVLRVMLVEKGLESYNVPPTTLKKFICGNGNANKNLMLEQTFRKFGIGSDTLTDDNQVDAFALAQFGKTVFGKEKLTKNEQVLLSKIERIL